MWCAVSGQLPGAQHKAFLRSVYGTALGQGLLSWVKRCLQEAGVVPRGRASRVAQELRELKEQ